MISFNAFATKCPWPAWASVVAVLVLGIALANAHAATPAGPLFPAPVYVTLQASNAVQTLPSGRICTGLPGAHYMAVTPDGERLLVSSANLPEAYLVDAKTCKILATFEVGPTTQGVTISPNGHWGLVVSAGNGTVAVIDIEVHKLVKIIQVGAAPHNSVFNSNGRLAYVTLQGGAAVVVIDMQSLTKVREFATIKLPHNLDFSADGKTLWIRDFVGNVVAVDAATGKQIAEVPVGPSHAGIDVLSSGKYAFTGAIGGRDVDVIDPKTFKVAKRIDVGQGPHGVRSSRDGRWIYAAVTGTNMVAVIDAHTLHVVKQIPLDGKFPFWIAVAGED